MLARVSLPVKLVAVAMLLVPLAGVASGVTGVRLLHGYLGVQADRQLRNYATSLLSGSFVTQPVFGGPHPGSQVGAGISVEIVDPGGRRIVRSGNGTGPYNGVPVSVAWISAHVGRIATVPDPRGHGSWRVVVEGIHYTARRDQYLYGEEVTSIAVSARTLPGLPGVVVVGMNLAGIGHTTGKFLLIDLAVTAFALLVLAVAGARLLRGSLRPLALAGRAAEAAVAGGTPLPPPDPRLGRLGDLGRAVNTALARAQEAAAPPSPEIAAARESTERMLAALAGTAADFRRSLAVVKGFADCYRSGRMRAPADLDRMMTRVEEETARMAEAAGRLGTAAQPLAGEVAVTPAGVLGDTLGDTLGDGGTVDGDGDGDGDTLGDGGTVDGDGDGDFAGA